MSIDVLFVVAPYAAALCFVAALLGRVSFGQRAVDPPHEEHATNHRAFRRLRAALAVGLLGVGAGHVAMLATPALLRIWNQEVGRLIGFELVLFGFGVITFVAFVSMVLLVVSQRHSTGSPVDWACYGLLLVVVATGLIVAVRYRWGSAWSSVTLSPYLRSLVEFRPDPELVVTLPYTVRLHVLSGIALIGLFPFTRPASAMGAVIRRVIVRAVAPVGEAIAGFARDLSDQLGARGRNLLWPEED